MYADRKCLLNREKVIMGWTRVIYLYVFSSFILNPISGLQNQFSGLRFYFNIREDSIRVYGIVLGSFHLHIPTVPFF